MADPVEAPERPAEQEQEPVTEHGKPPEPPAGDEGNGPAAPAAEKVARPKTKRGGAKEEPQTAFGDHTVNVELPEGVALLNFLEVMKKNKKAASTYSKAAKDMDTAISEMGLKTGVAVDIRVGPHLVTVADVADDKEIEAFTRKGGQRKSVKFDAGA